jgi:uncharacterized membrane protein
MKTISKATRASLAASAAALFLLAGCAEQPASSTSTAAAGHCMGVNACKGHGSCKSTNNACKSQNACKGKGFVVLDQGVCEQVGGKFSTG